MYDGVHLGYFQKVLKGLTTRVVLDVAGASRGVGFDLGGLYGRRWGGWDSSICSSVVEREGGRVMGLFTRKELVDHDERLLFGFM